jgi:hypothetical protein
MVFNSFPATRCIPSVTAVGLAHPVTLLPPTSRFTRLPRVLLHRLPQYVSGRMCSFVCCIVRLLLSWCWFFVAST